MRREGRQHGIVLAHPYFAPSLSHDVRKARKKPSNLIDGPLMGVFTKAPSKPTNKSRYTSRCRVPRCLNCHDHPVNKARPKTKGNHRHKDEFSDFYLKGDHNKSDETAESNYDSDEGAESDCKKELICQVGDGDCKDDNWVFVEKIRVSVKV